MKIKNYPKLYEDFLTSRRVLNRCRLDMVSTENGMNWKEYVRLIAPLMADYQKQSFDRWLKLFWLIKKFCYFGYVHYNIDKPNNTCVDRALSIFFKTYVGWDAKTVTKDPAFRRVSTYFYDFFPDLDALDPFKQKFRYPYKKMNIDCLCLVYLMPERLELLKVGEKKKMDLSKFVDYVINYINCYNEDHGKDVYSFYWNRLYLPYIKIKK
jgi:hypothetical protein